MEKKVRKKMIIGLVLGSIYLFFGTFTLVGFLVSLTAHEDVNGEPVDSTPLVWLFPLALSLFCLLAFASILIKLKFQKKFIWFFCFDFVIFPVAIFFYYYVKATFHEPWTTIAIKRRTVKTWALTQFILIAILHSVYGLLWFVILIACFQAMIVAWPLDQGLLLVVVLGLIYLLVLLFGFLGALLVLIYSFKNLKAPKWAILFSFSTIGITWPLALILFDKRIVIQDEPTPAVNLQMIP